MYVGCGRWGEAYTAKITHPEDFENGSTQMRQWCRTSRGRGETNTLHDALRCSDELGACRGTVVECDDISTSLQTVLVVKRLEEHGAITRVRRTRGSVHSPRPKIVDVRVGHRSAEGVTGCHSEARATSAFRPLDETGGLEPRCWGSNALCFLFLTLLDIFTQRLYEVGLRATNDACRADSVCKSKVAFACRLLALTRWHHRALQRTRQHRQRGPRCLRSDE